MQALVRCSIIYLAEKKRLPRHALPGGAPVVKAQKFRNRIGLSAPSAHFEQSPHNRPHHIAQESVSGYVEGPMRLVVGDPSGFVDRADGGLVVRPYLLETRKIVRSEQIFRRPVHFLHVQFAESAPIGVLLLERVLASVDAVNVFAPLCIETGVEVVTHRLYARNGN